MADDFAFGLARANLPRLASVDIQAPDAVLDLGPRPFMAKRQQMRETRRGIGVADPVILFPHHFGCAAVGRHLDNPTERMRRPCFREADIAAQQIDLEVLRHILGDARIHELPIGAARGHRDVEAVRHPVDRALRGRLQIQRAQFVAVPEIGFRLHGVDARAHKFDLARERQGGKIGQLRDLAGCQLDTKQIHRAVALRTDQQAFFTVVPAVLGEIQMVAVARIGSQLRDFDAGARVGKGALLGWIDMSGAHFSPFNSIRSPYSSRAL